MMLLMTGVYVMLTYALVHNSVEWKLILFIVLLNFFSNFIMYTLGIARGIFKILLDQKSLMNLLKKDIKREIEKKGK